MAQEINQEKTDIVLQSAASNVDVARQLYEIINNEQRQSKSPEAVETEPEAEPQAQAPTETQEEVTVHEYSSTQTPLSQEFSKKVKETASSVIADEDVHQEEGLEDHPHITVKYGLHTENIEDVKPLLTEVAPITATAGS